MSPCRLEWRHTFQLLTLFNKIKTLLSGMGREVEHLIHENSQLLETK